MDFSDPAHNSARPLAGDGGILVMKFGGTSVAGVTGLRRVFDLVQQSLASQRVLLVASAMSGITDLLVAGAQRVQGAEAVLASYSGTHRRALAALAGELGPERTRELERRLSILETELARLLKFNAKSPSTLRQ